MRPPVLNATDLAGTRTVPIDATAEMIAAALAVDWSGEDEAGVAHNVWHAMVAAAPTKSSGGGQGGDKTP